MLITVFSMNLAGTLFPIFTQFEGAGELVILQSTPSMRKTKPDHPGSRH